MRVREVDAEYEVFFLAVAFRAVVVAADFDVAGLLVCVEVLFAADVDFGAAWAVDGTAAVRAANRRQVRRAVRRNQFRITDNPLRDSLLEVVSAL